MKYYFIVFSVFICLHLSAQIEGVITLQDGSPHPYASIFYKGTNIGTASMLNGEFALKASSQFDTIQISSLGFESQYFLQNQISDSLKITLSPRVYEIDMLEIAPSFKQKREKTILLSGTVPKDILLSCDMYIGYKVAIKFKPTFSQQKLISLKYFSKKVCDENNKMRIRIMSCNDNGEPFNDLCNPIITNNKKNSWNKIKLKKNKSYYRHFFS